MSRRRKQTNVVGNVLGITGKIVVYVLVGFLLFQGMTKGYAFGYELFNPKAVSAGSGEAGDNPGRRLCLSGGENSENIRPDYKRIYIYSPG